MIVRSIMSATVIGVLAAIGLAACSSEEPEQPSPSPTVTPAPPVDPADWVFLGGTVLTMDAVQPRAEAIAVSGEVIVAVGSEDDVRAHIGDATQVVDLQGSTLMPGFVDSHSHGLIGGERSPEDEQEWMLSVGITTTADLSVNAEVLAALQDSDDAGDLRVRVSAYLLATDGCGHDMGEWYLDHPPTREPGEMLRIGGVKVYTDGGSCERPATSFAQSDGSFGNLFFTVDELTQLLGRLDGQGYQIAAHALGDRAMDTTLEAFARVMESSDNPLRHRMEHNALVPPGFEGRYDQVGVIGTIFGSYPTCFFTSTGEGFAYLTDQEHLEWEWQWRRLIDGNPRSTFAWSSDGHIFNDPSPIGALFGFTTRHEYSPQGDLCEPGPPHAAGAISVEEALHLMTVNSAYSLDRDQEVGSLTVGRFADIIILTDDPTVIDAFDIPNTLVIFTMVAGKPEYCVNVFSGLCE